MIYMQCPTCGVKTVILKNDKTYYECGYNPDGTSECGAFAVKKEEITKCTCEIRELFWRGCKCGWWEKEKNENNSRTA